MKRFHVHVAVDDLAASVRFYSTLFAAPPTVEKYDYAKWMLDDPRVNFAISMRGVASGLDHVGIQAENEAELADVTERLRHADRPVLEQGATTCCYAQSEKAWVVDPAGLSWETFLTRGESTVYGESAELDGLRTAHTGTSAACCAPRPEEIAAVAGSACGCSKADGA